MDHEAILKEDAEAQLLREAEERRFLYRDVEELIENGFLTHTLVIEGVPIVFRSFLPLDLTRLQARTSAGREDAYLRWSVASAIWMVDGFEVSLDPKDNAAWGIYDSWVKHLPKPVVEALFFTIVGFNKRLGRAVRLVEAFCYETYSRGLWRMMGRPTEDLGNANLIRRMWVAFNLTEDQSKLDEQQWSHTRAIVGSMTNKGAKHITKQLKKFEEREEQRRQRVIEEAVNWVIRGDERRKPITVMVNGKAVEVPRVHSAQTTQDLEDEMQRVFTGEQDWHDHLVDQYTKKVREQVTQRRVAAQKATKEVRRRAEAAEAEGTPPLVGYTREQMEKLRPEVLAPKTTATVHESAQSNYLFNRYFDPELKPGVLTPDLKVEAPGSVETQAFGKGDAEPSDEPTLQEKIASRKPKLGEP
jgi:hypothetical protein